MRFMRRSSNCHGSASPASVGSERRPQRPASHPAPGAPPRGGVLLTRPGFLPLPMDRLGRQMIRRMALHAPPAPATISASTGPSFPLDPLDQQQGPAGYCGKRQDHRPDDPAADSGPGHVPINVAARWRAMWHVRSQSLTFSSDSPSPHARWNTRHRPGSGPGPTVM